MTPLNLLIVLCQVGLQATGDTMVAYGMRMRPIGIFWVVLGTAMLAGGFGLFVTLLHYLPLSVVAPAGALTHLVVAFFSRVFLHERVSRERWVGASLVACGVFFVLWS